MSITVFANCRLFDGTSEELRDGMHVAIEDGSIREVSERPIRLSSDIETFDCGKRVLMPGLIDLHFHAYGVTFDMHKLDHMPKPLLVSHAIRHLEGAALRGFTTVRDTGGGDVGLALAIEHGLVQGPRFLYGGRALSQTGGHGDMRHGEEHSPCSCGYSGVLSQVVDGPEEVRKVVRDELRKGATHIKVLITGGVTSPSDPINMRQFTDEEIAAVVEEVSSRGKYVVAHCHTDEGARRCVQAGIRSIDHATNISATTAAAIAKAGSYTVPTLAALHVLLASGDKAGMPADRLPKVAGLLENMLKSIETCRRAGVKVGLGTDVCGTEFHRVQASELRFRSEIDRPIDILRSATSVNAEIAQRGDSLGRIAPGYAADVIVLDGDPLKDLSVFERYESHMPVVMRAGKFLRNTL